MCIGSMPNRVPKHTTCYMCSGSGYGSGLYSGGLTWSILLGCDHTGCIFTCEDLLLGPVLLCARRDTELAYK